MSTSQSESTDKFIESHEGQAEGSSDSSPHLEKGEKTKHRPIREGSWLAFAKELEETVGAEEKLKKLVAFMEKSLAQQGAPSFRDFWEARKACIPLFKENVNPALRSDLWKSFSELSKEARRLKEILDDQSAFAVEQIEKAIQALEEELASLQAPHDLPAMEGLLQCSSLKEHAGDYQMAQGRLNLLNAHAARIGSLRKELIKTDMRVRQKNKLFNRLSKAGDQIFPERRKLIEEVSRRFISDVDGFIQAVFKPRDPASHLFAFREEIKGLQAVAKELTLNTEAFTHTRTALSKCWDEIKEIEKERKKVRAEKKAVFKDNAEALLKRIEEAREKQAQGEWDLEQLDKELSAISSEMRDVELGRDEVVHLKDRLAEVRKPIFEAKEREADERRRQNQEKEHQRKEELNALTHRIETFLAGIFSMEMEAVNEERQGIMDAMAQAPLRKEERAQLERLLRPLKDILAEKREQALMALPEDDRQLLQHLREILVERRNRRKDSKELLESYRKAQGASGLDFQKALEFKELIDQERERYDKYCSGVEEVEDRIRHLEAQA